MSVRVAAIVAAAGCGRRLGGSTPKPFVSLKGKPLVSYCLRRLDRSPAIDAIVIAAAPERVGRLARLVRSLRLRKVIGVYPGGATRSASVRNCLRRLGPGYDIVLVQDAARPFLDERMISGSVRLARRYGGCVVAMPVSDTVKEVGRGAVVVRTLDRRRIYRAQTPQAFRRRLLERAYARAGRGAAGATDDADLVQRLGVRVRVLEGSARNMKITTKTDLDYAEALL